MLQLVWLSFVLIKYELGIKPISCSVICSSMVCFLLMAKHACWETNITIEDYEHIFSAFIGF